MPIHVYSFTTDPKPDWNESHAFQPEIQKYILDFTEKYDLRRHCILDTIVESARWDPENKIWILSTRNVNTGKVTEATSVVFIVATGLLSEPSIPAFPRKDNFKGVSFHSSRWREDVDMRGKRVAVIGNGSSGYVSSSE